MQAKVATATSILLALCLCLCGVCTEGFHWGASTIGSKRILSQLSTSSDDYSEIEAASSPSLASNNDVNEAKFGDSVPFVPRAGAESDGGALFEFADEEGHSSRIGCEI